MSHHASGPNFGFPRGDARLDMTDLYVFSKPGDPGKSILILNVHPSFRLDSPEPTTKEPFAPGALYEIKIDTNGDALADICFSVQFASSEHGQQTATVRRLEGARAVGFGDNGEVVVQGARVSVGQETLVTEVGDFRFFFGWRSDPFFFDAMGNFNQMQFTGEDFFKDKNVCSIVLELPNSVLGRNEVGIWARTVEKTAAGWVQADRGARPLQAVFLVGEEREAYLTGEPANDDRFIGVFAHELEHTGGYAHEDAKAVARKLLPDILSYHPREPLRFPNNGRTLTDDVVDQRNQLTWKYKVGFDLTIWARKYSDRSCLKTSNENASRPFHVRSAGQSLLVTLGGRPYTIRVRMPHGIRTDHELIMAKRQFILPESLRLFLLELS